MDPKIFWMKRQETYRRKTNNGFIFDYSILTSDGDEESDI
jgi:hypothetical protein